MVTFQVLAKPTGAVCNFDCNYCFFSVQEALSPDGESRMTDGVLKAYIRQVLEAQSGPHVTVAWQGGEPTLMGLPFFERAMALVRKYARPGIRIEHTIQTNGTLLDEAWCEFFRDNRALVGLSLDGPRELHDALRVDKGGHPTSGRASRDARARGEPDGQQLHLRRRVLRLGARAQRGPDAMTLRTPATVDQPGNRVTAYVHVKQGERVGFQLSWHPSHEPPPAVLDVEQELAWTEAHWRK